MGKWTPSYTDDVLHAKISTLISGAIRRAAVERETTSMTYENFVSDLETGDAFTTSLIDILVKEVSDRRARPATERRLIADRTIKSLRLLASSARMLPARPSASRSHARRTGGLSDYLTAPPSDFHEMDEEDDEFDSLMDNGNGVEGARVSNDLYDAFASNPLPSWPPPTTRRVTASPSPVSDEWHPPPLRSPTSATRPWSTLGSTSISNPSLLSRQASIRRAARSRVDFNEYSRARRSNLRDPLTSHPEPAETVTEPRPSSQPGRRFFPFPRPRRSEASATAHWALVNDADDGPLFTPPWLDSDARYPPEPLTTSPDSEGRDDNDTLIIRAPRLRRGGVRAPESMLSRHASPVVPENAPPTPPPQLNPETIPVVPASEEPAAYPTPGSTENESFA